MVSYNSVSTLLLFALVALLSGSDAYSEVRFKTMDTPSVATVKASTRSECHAACVKNTKCNTAIFFYSARRCYLKAEDYTKLVDTEKGYLVALFDAPSFKGFSEGDFVQQPRSTDRGALKLTGKSVGMKSSFLACERACYDTYSAQCIYVQQNLKSKECFIAKSCTGVGCKDVRQYWKVGVRNFSRVYCKNAAYQKAWASWTGSYPKGATACTDVIL